LPPVLIDHSGLENALINLAVNSRDAMPKGGKFIISNDERTLNTQVIDSTPEDMKPGDYVHITVTDTGEGMDANTLSRAFEPFFTTKERGKGTGLGLAMIYGFAKQSGGNVSMMSSPGAGTTIELWLPAAPGLVVDRPAPAETPETGFRFNSADEVLVVDDEAELLEVAIYILQEMGCSVLSALNAEQALQLIAVNDSIKVLLTDIVMPGGMNGVELAAKARALNPNIKVLYTSGFPEEVLADKSGLRLDAPFLQKPYTIAALGTAISLALQSSVEYQASPGVKS
jgi:CheY-like chemotaxis protein